MLKANSICKTFQGPSKINLLKEISLTLNPQESLAIMGASGVGKSTLLHILGSLEKPDSGEIFIHEKPLSFNPAKTRNEHIGFVFQSFFLMEHLSVLQNVLMPAKIARKSMKSSSQATLRALDLLKKVGLLDRRDQPAKNLSGGEKQRVCIARALINNPSIIFADEPTGNLDGKSSLAIQNLLLESVKGEKKALIVATHDQHFAKQCDRTLWLIDGKLHNSPTT